MKFHPSRTVLIMQKCDDVVFYATPSDEIDGFDVIKQHDIVEEHICSFTDLYEAQLYLKWINERRFKRTELTFSSWRKRI